MATTAPRPPVTTTTVPSPYVSQSAARLFLAGYLSKLHFIEGEDGRLYFSLPSESQPGTRYQIEWDLNTGALRCTCPAGQQNVPCKHIRLFQLSRGWAVQEAGA
jgi:hypothetical protein